MITTTVLKWDRLVLQKDVDGMANNVGPDQTAPFGAV